ncbi:micro-fibrillar-associated protein [Plasmodium brasilianum]|uniref:Micro-fibrillar-associated protein n=1 Tax=Plasmodium brasilianum TaxID=5824 RepID=A0ACB9Y5Y2_PLABR|nr:micro-fibrillar-associated protein [Plasmodium brasilianum]
MGTVNELLNYFTVNDDTNDLVNSDKEKKEKAVVRRYFPGKKPHYAKKINADDDDDDDDDDEEDDKEDDEEDDYDYDNQFNEELTEKLRKKEQEKKKKKKGVAHKDIETQSNKLNAIDNRYERLKNKSKKSPRKEWRIKGDDLERLKRRVREVKVNDYSVLNKEDGNNVKGKDEKKDSYTHFPVSEHENDELDDEEDDEGVDNDDDDDEEDDDEDDEEDDDDDEEDDDEQNDYENTMKHEFISKNCRKTLIEKKTKEDIEKKKLENLNEEKELIEIEKKENVIKETLTQEMIEEKLKNKENNVYSSEEDFEDDEKDEELNEEEYELWKIRHMNRLKRDEQDRKKYEILKMEIKERRKMTDKEIIEENKKLPHKEKKKKKKMLFMQKYYHRGGFYQDLFEEGKEEIYLRDYNEPVYEDRIDKENLPKVLQVRRGNFGKQGQTKYTHLLDNDTSKKNSLWKNNDSLYRSKKKKDLFERPTYKKK